MNVYVASSWRNPYQQEIVQLIRAQGYDVYDFRHPKEGYDGFHWSEIDPNWKDWNIREYFDALDTPIADYGFDNDMNALEQADMCVLVLPSGRSAHIEAGYAVGAGKPVIVYVDNTFEPELMYKMCWQLVDNYTDLLDEVSYINELLESNVSN